MKKKSLATSVYIHGPPVGGLRGWGVRVGRVGLCWLRVAGGRVGGHGWHGWGGGGSGDGWPAYGPGMGRGIPDG